MTLWCCWRVRAIVADDGASVGGKKRKKGNWRGGQLYRCGRPFSHLIDANVKEVSWAIHACCSFSHTGSLSGIVWLRGHPISMMPLLTGCPVGQMFADAHCAKYHRPRPNPRME